MPSARPPLKDTAWCSWIRINAVQHRGLGERERERERECVREREKSERDSERTSAPEMTQRRLSEADTHFRIVHSSHSGSAERNGGRVRVRP